MTRASRGAHRWVLVARRWVLVWIAAAALCWTSGCTSPETSDSPGTTTKSASPPSASVIDSSDSAASTSAPIPTPSVIDVPKPSSAAPFSLDPAEQEAADRAAIETQWVSFWNAYDAIVRTPKDQRAAELANVAVSPVLDNALVAASEADTQGIDNYGPVTHRLSWQRPINGATTATMADCQDQSQTGTLRVATGEILTVGDSRSNMSGKFVKGIDGRWRLNQIFFMVDAAC